MKVHVTRSSQFESAWQKVQKKTRLRHTYTSPVLSLAWQGESCTLSARKTVLTLTGSDLLRITCGITFISGRPSMTQKRGLSNRMMFVYFVQNLWRFAGGNTTTVNEFWEIRPSTLPVDQKYVNICTVGLGHDFREPEFKNAGSPEGPTVHAAQFWKCFEE